MVLVFAKISILSYISVISFVKHGDRNKITILFLKYAKFLLVCIATINSMSAVFLEAGDSPAPLTICPRCGRQVRIDGHCDCEAIFFAGYKRK
jgi:hypothetical protein